jgi:hypothetical protein
MSTILDTQTPAAEPRPEPTPRTLWYVIATAVLVVGVVAAVLVFGVHRPPAVDPVESGQAPEPPASLAWQGWDGSQDCIHTIDPAGVIREVTCDRDGFELLGWTDDGLVVRRWFSSGERLETLDPDTGEAVDAVIVRDVEAALERGLADGDQSLYSRWRDGILTVTEAAPDDTVLWATEAPETYRVERGVVAPDGSVLAGVDTAGRLLVFDATGGLAPRLWHDDVPQWGSLVWEGTALPEELDTDG